jgi:hypothetical protein
MTTLTPTLLPSTSRCTDLRWLQKPETWLSRWKGLCQCYEGPNSKPDTLTDISQGSSSSSAMHTKDNQTVVRATSHSVPKRSRSRNKNNACNPERKRVSDLERATNTETEYAGKDKRAIQQANEPPTNTPISMKLPSLVNSTWPFNTKGAKRKFFLIAVTTHLFNTIINTTSV